MESLRLRFSLFLSCLLHLVIISGLRFIKSKEPILITFPVDLITISVPFKEKIDDSLKVEPVKKKEEISIEKKKKVKVEEKKEEPKKIEQQVQPKEQQSLPSLSLDTAKFPFTYYINQIRKKVTENWSWAQNYSGELKTVVYFKILRNGSIGEIKVKDSSNNKYFDNLALRAVEAASPFPPLPEAYVDEYLGVFFEFKYKD